MGVLRSPRKWKMGSFFIPPAPMIEDGGVLRSLDPEDRRTSLHLRRTPPIFEEIAAPPRLLSDLRPILRGRRSKIGGSSIFGAEDRRLEMGEFLRSSAPRIDNERVIRSSEPEDRRTHPHLRSPVPEARRKPPTFDLRSSIFDPEDRRTPYLRSSTP